MATALADSGVNDSAEVFQMARDPLHAIALMIKADVNGSPELDLNRLNSTALSRRVASYRRMKRPH